MAIAMMETTLKDVIGMEEIAVVIMLKKITVMIANALIQISSLNVRIFGKNQNALRKKIKINVIRKRLRKIVPRLVATAKPKSMMHKVYLIFIMYLCFVQN